VSLPGQNYPNIMVIKRLVAPFVVIYRLAHDVIYVVFMIVRCHWYYNKWERNTGDIKIVKYNFVYKEKPDVK